jgi:hypothetical protein
MHRHSSKRHDDIRENAAPDPGQTGAQANRGVMNDL